MRETSLVVAIPSKGRLQENANSFFAGAGLAVLQAGGARTYRGAIAGMEGVEVAYLSASEITGELASGAIHLGVTGRDLVEDAIAGWPKRVDLTVPLGFGRADVVVAVPEAWIDVMSMADLEDVAADFRSRHGRRLRVASKYLTLTRRFFAEHGLTDYRIVESLGATEGAPASGVADIIVDITTTGTTLRANALKPLEDGLILASEAYLVASLTAAWTPAALAALRTILDRINGEAAARSLREIKADPVDAGAAARSVAELFGAAVPFGVATAGPLVLHCTAASAAACADWLRQEMGARTVSVSAVDTLFSATNPVFDRLVPRLRNL